MSATRGHGKPARRPEVSQHLLDWRYELGLSNLPISLRGSPSTKWSRAGTLEGSDQVATIFVGMPPHTPDHHRGQPPIWDFEHGYSAISKVCLRSSRFSIDQLKGVFGLVGDVLGKCR